MRDYDADVLSALCDPFVQAVLDEMGRQDQQFVRYARFAREFAARVDRRVAQQCGPPEHIAETAETTQPAEITETAKTTANLVRFAQSRRLGPWKGDETIAEKPEQAGRDMTTEHSCRRCEERFAPTWSGEDLCPQCATTTEIKRCGSCGEEHVCVQLGAGWYCADSVYCGERIIGA